MCRHVKQRRWRAGTGRLPGVGGGQPDEARERCTYCIDTSPPERPPGMPTRSSDCGEQMYRNCCVLSSSKRVDGAPPSPRSSATVSATGRSGAKLEVARRSPAERHCPSGACGGEQARCRCRSRRWEASQAGRGQTRDRGHLHAQMTSLRCSDCGEPYLDHGRLQGGDTVGCGLWAVGCGLQQDERRRHGT